MKDKERMLMAIVSALQFANHEPGEDGHIYLDFSKRKIQPGEIVISVSSGIHEWTAAIFVKYLESHYYLIRELGGTKTCRLYHDALSVLRNIRENPYYGPLLLEGDDYIFYRKTIAAFKRGRDSDHFLDKIEFPEKHTARIFVRVKWWGIAKENITPSTLTYRPFSFEMHWTKKTTIQAILDALIEHGYGMKSIERVIDGHTQNSDR